MTSLRFSSASAIAKSALFLTSVESRASLAAARLAASAFCFISAWISISYSPSDHQDQIVPMNDLLVGSARDEMLKLLRPVPDELAEVF